MCMYAGQMRSFLKLTLVDYYYDEHITTTTLTRLILEGIFKLTYLPYAGTSKRPLVKTPQI